MTEGREPQDGLPRNGTSSALEAAHIGMAGSGRVYGFTAYNSKGSDQFVLVFDASTIPADGETADIVFPINAGDSLLIGWLPGRWFRAGCVLCNSSTAPTKTAGSADCFFDVQYA